MQRARPGEEPADAVFEFGARNGLNPGFRGNLLQAICGNPADPYKINAYCTRMRARAFDRNVQSHFGYSRTDEETGEETSMYPEKLKMWEDEEPADAVYRFAVKSNIPQTHRQALIWMLCSSPEYGLSCSRPERLEALLQDQESKQA